MILSTLIVRFGQRNNFAIKTEHKLDEDSILILPFFRTIKIDRSFLPAKPAAAATVSSVHELLWGESCRPYPPPPPPYICSCAF